MSRAAIVATIVTGILAFSSPTAAGDANADTELGKLGDKWAAAFRCLTYARMFHDDKEEKRLLEIGIKAARDFFDGAKRIDPKMRELWAGFSTDFLVGAMYDSETTKAYDEIVKYEDGLPYLPRKQWLDQAAAQAEAERSYRKSNCSLIN